jgi:Fic family protein
MSHDTLMAGIAAQKARFDALRREKSAQALTSWDHVQDIELTYTSNAIEGNTLTAVETTMVIEQGITVGGKPLKDHLEAIDHFEALGYVRSLARQASALTEMDIRNLHRLVVQRSMPEAAGHYAEGVRYILTDTGRHVFPSPAEIRPMMGDFAAWLGQAVLDPATAFAAHRRLVDIHPFADGNGRTARLLMNLILLRGGYPPIAVRPQDRPGYIASLQVSEAIDGMTAFEALLYRRLAETLDDYIAALDAALPLR